MHSDGATPIRTCVEAILRDLRFAFRSVCKSPRFITTAVLSLLVGIGGTTAIFSVVDALLLRSLDYPDAERLYVVHEVLPQLKAPVAGVNALHFREWRSAAQSFEQMALLSSFDTNLTGSGAPDRIPAARVSPQLFQMVGVRAAIGRTLTDDDDHPGHDRVVVLSHELWRRQFGGDPQIVGRAVALDGQPYTVVGVMPSGFAPPHVRYLYARASAAEQAQLWTPFALWDEPYLAQMYAFVCLVRLRASVAPSQAEAELNVLERDIAARAAQAMPIHALLVPLQEQVVGRSRPPLRLLLGAAFVVLLIGCVNVGHLLSARHTARRRDVAIRRALGASTTRLAWELLAEGIAIGLIGAIAGVTTAYAALRVIQSSGSVDVPRLAEATIDGRALLFTLVLSVGTGLLSAAVPVLGIALSAPLESSKAASIAGGSARSGRRIGWLLVGLEVGMSTVSLVVAGLLLHSFLNVLAVDRGFHASGGTAVQLNMTDARYAASRDRVAFLDRLLEGMRSLPHVLTGIASRVPLTGPVGGSVFNVEGTTVSRVERLVVAPAVTDPGYFAAVGIPTVDGRIFNPSDRARGTAVAVISSPVAERAWPGQNPVGRRFRLGPEGAPLMEVVGVVGQVHSVSVIDGPTLDVYIPYWQSDMSLYSNAITLVVATATDSTNVSGAVRLALRELDPQMPLPAFRTLNDIADASVAPLRFQRNVVVMMAAIALLLASIGIYGVVSHTVAQRTKELGIRKALGAPKSAIERLIVGQVAVPVALGLTVGMFAMWPLGGLLRNLVFGVGPLDPPTLAGTAMILGAVAVVAAYVPAHRATRLDPLVALRDE